MLKIEDIIKRIYEQELDNAEWFSYQVSHFVKLPLKVKETKKAVQVCPGVIVFVENNE